VKISCVLLHCNTRFASKLQEMAGANQKPNSIARDVFINFKPKSSDPSSSADAPQEPAAQEPLPSKNVVPSKRFQFIDNSSATSSSGNSTQVRRHVMQEFMRQKRWQDKKRQDALPKGSDQSLRRPVLKIKSQRRTHQSHSAASSTASSPSASAAGSLDSLPSQPLILPRQHEAWEDHQVEEVQRSDWIVGRAKKGHPDFFFLEPSAFAQLADLSSDESSHRTSVSSCSSFSSVGSPMHSENSYPQLEPTPQSALSAARTDPFDCLPMTLNQQDQELFDFYVNVMPACSYGFERRSPHAHNWYLSVFVPEAMKGAVCFQNTVLVHAANTQAWVLGLAETTASIEHRARASQMLLEHFEKCPTDTTDASISATLSAAALEDFDPRVERREYAWMHFRAAVQKIRDRGGPSALVQHNRLQMLINWSDYIFSGYNSSGPTFFFNHDPMSMPSDPAHAHQIAAQEIQEQCEEFITFLRCTEHLAFVQAQVEKTPIAVQRQPMRYTVFQQGQPLSRLLASPPGLRYTETGKLKQILSRLAALLTINTAIWEYRHLTDTSEEFFCELVENIQYNELDKHLSVEALIQILLSGSKNPALLDTERPWFVGRMLKVAKRLKQPSFQKLNDVLLSYLTLGPDLHPVMSEWENELRLEILEAPLTSYVLPLMQT
jgi:hypothetical protein